jgi:molybdopterin molybdotransferase
MEKDINEIDDGSGYVGYRQAFDIINSHVSPVGVEDLPLAACVGHITAEDLVARVSYPSQDVSLKDGYAVRSGDLAAASQENQVSLKIVGSVFAGDSGEGFAGEVTPGNAIKVCSGAPIPRGAEAVVAEEFCEEVTAEEVRVRADADPGRNVLRAGGEVKEGAVVLKQGRVLLPGYLGLAAAAGINDIKVYRRPRVAVIGVGDEVVAPGTELRPGQLYASNLVTMAAWLGSFKIPFVTSVVHDDEAAIKAALEKHLPQADVIMTSGGAWGSERDLVIGVLNKLGWKHFFHHVRMGPGKGVSFGLWEGKRVFCLPGGPASNEMAFIQLALPGTLRLGGDTRHPLQTVYARLTEPLEGRHHAWTEFKDATLTTDDNGNYSVGLYRHRSRLQAIASANSLVCVPEGARAVPPGELVPVQVLAPRLEDAWLETETPRS